MHVLTALRSYTNQVMRTSSHWRGEAAIGVRLELTIHFFRPIHLKYELSPSRRIATFPYCLISVGP